MLNRISTSFGIFVHLMSESFLKHPSYRLYHKRTTLFSFVPKFVNTCKWPFVPKVPKQLCTFYQHWTWTLVTWNIYKWIFWLQMLLYFSSKMWIFSNLMITSLRILSFISLRVERDTSNWYGDVSSFVLYLWMLFRPLV